MLSLNVPHQDGEMARDSNPFKSDEDQRVILGCVQLFVFAIALLMLLVVSNI